MDAAEAEKLKATGRYCYVPSEKRNVDGSLAFCTSDGTRYCREVDGGPIRRMVPKVNGREAKELRRIGRKKSL